MVQYLHPFTVDDPYDNQEAGDFVARVTPVGEAIDASPKDLRAVESAKYSDLIPPVNQDGPAPVDLETIPSAAQSVPVNQLLPDLF